MIEIPKVQNVRLVFVFLVAKNYATGAFIGVRRKNVTNVKVVSKKYKI